MMMTARQAAECLTERGIRPSAQRVAIYRWLANHPVHPTSEQVYKALRPQTPSLSRTTVHQTLLLLANSGLAQRLVIEEDKLRFDANTTPHAHFRCTSCGCVLDLPVTQTIFPPTLPPDCQITETHLYLLGRCSHCNRSQD